MMFDYPKEGNLDIKFKKKKKLTNKWGNSHVLESEGLFKCQQAIIIDSRLFFFSFFRIDLDDKGLESHETAG